MGSKVLNFAPSRNIIQIVYDDESFELSVTFSRGDTYKYSQVPANVAMAFESVPSAGQYFEMTIKNQYPQERQIFY